MPEKLPVRSITSNWPILVLITVRLSQVLLLRSPLQMDFLPSLIKIIFLSLFIDETLYLDHHWFGWWFAIRVDGQWDNFTNYHYHHFLVLMVLPFPCFLTINLNLKFKCSLMWWRFKQSLLCLFFNGSITSERQLLFLKA